MKRLLATVLPIGLSAAVTFAAMAPRVAFAFGPRSPQVAFSTTSLQNYFNGVGESITVSADQLDAQVWSTSATGNSTITLMIELSGNATSNSIGVYNGGDGASPTLFQMFPASASAGWYVTAHFSSGSLSVALFDNNGTYQGSTSYSGVDQNDFGFYIQGPGGTFYSQDYRNPGGMAQALTYAGTGVDYGDWWECFEDTAYDSGTSDFDDAVLLLQALSPTPTRNRSWGSVKTRF